MVYYEDSKWQICPKMAEYRAYGQLKRTYTDNPRWWEDFVNKWWHHESLKLHEVTPTQAQLDRLEACNIAGITEGFQNDVAQFVESGIVGEGLPDSFVQNVDLSNSNAVWEYTQIVNVYIQAEVDKQNALNGTDFERIQNCTAYKDISTYPHQQLCVDLLNWNAQVWEATRGIMYDVQIGAIDPPDKETFIGMLPEFGA